MEKLAVPDAFDAVAPRYDLMCRLNPGYLGMLSDAARALAPLPLPLLLDLCCGTGLSTQALRRAHPGVPIVALDGSVGMLAQARQ
jgi:ubiquinone/menaquinone biosynthesis C-methylase UbiE